MALKGFFEKRDITGKDLQTIFSEAVLERAPAFLATKTFFYEGDVIACVEDILYISNSLTRDEALTYFRGKTLGLRIAQGGTLYQGDTVLTGLGRYRNLNILKLRLPESLKHKDPRGSYRLRTFNQTPLVSFSFQDQNVAKGRVLDVSMTGVGFSPDTIYNMKTLDLKVGQSMAVDVRLEDNWKVSTFAKVRHVTHNKVGVEFDDLGGEQKNHLFKFIVKMRKVEVQKKLALQERILAKKEQQISTDTPVETMKPQKPRVMVYFDTERSLADFLEKVLCRRFDVFLEPYSVADMRDQINEINPDLLLFELLSQDSSEISRRKKIAAAMAGYVPFMLYGEGYSPEFVMTHFGSDAQRKLLLDVTGRNTILSYKKIESFFGKK